MRRAALLAFAALIVAAPAAAQRADPCARFEQPLAYNACLAMHGPRAPTTRPASPNENEAAPLHGRRGPHGRQRLEFNVGGD